jgi:predicted NAD/FAD-binding protein
MPVGSGISRYGASRAQSRNLSVTLFEHGEDLPGK